MNPLLLMLAICIPADSSAWPGFLGAGASPIDPASIPLTWSHEQNVAWDASLPGHGQSSPVIWGDRVFVTSVEGASKEKLHVICLSLKDGKIQWDYTRESSNPETNSVYISRAAPTPVVDADRVCVFFEGGDIVALNHQGELQWHRSLSKDYGKFVNKFGLSGSPVQLDDRIAVLVDDEGPSYLVCLSKMDGSVLWKTDRTSRTSWSSPAVVMIEGAPQIVCSSAGSVDGYDPGTGAVLWTWTEVGGNTATTPTTAGEGEILIAASPGRTGENTESARKSNGKLRVRRDGDLWKPEMAWRNEAATPSWASPVVAGGYAYWVNRAGVIYCLDAETGEQKYAERSKQSCWATPLVVDGRIYFFGKDGVTTVLAQGPEYRELAVNTLWDPAKPPTDNGAPQAEETTEERRGAAAMFSGPTQYGVAAVSGSLLIRVGSHVYCIREKSAE
jgi:outer membrane protein assembly factor BamB